MRGWCLSTFQGPFYWHLMELLFPGKLPTWCSILFSFLNELIWDTDYFTYYTLFITDLTFFHVCNLSHYFNPTLLLPTIFLKCVWNYVAFNLERKIGISMTITIETETSRVENKNRSSFLNKSLKAPWLHGETLCVYMIFLFFGIWLTLKVFLCEWTEERKNIRTWYRCHDIVQLCVTVS